MTLNYLQALAIWLTNNFALESTALRDIELRDVQYTEIFEAARTANALIMTKDSDFIDLVCRLEIPPQILWLTCGNVTNRNLKQLLTATLSDALERSQQGEAIVEISNNS